MSKILEELALPVVAAPMFLISNPDLVVSCCKQGILGSFPALNQRTTEGFRSWVHDIKSRISGASYAVNLIVHRTNPRLQADLAVCVEEQVPVVITSLGAVKEVVDAVHSYGGIVLHDVTTRRHAEKAAEAGVDGLILVCAGAGGHAGQLHPMAFIQEVRGFYDGIIALSGCISTGGDAAAAIAMGADLAYMGTRFINTQESAATDDYRQMIIESGVSDVVYTAAISGVPANFLRMSLEAAGITADQWGQAAKINFGDEMNTEAKAWKTIWSAGQGVAGISDNPTVKVLVDRLKHDYQNAVRRAQDRLG